MPLFNGFKHRSFVMSYIIFLLFTFLVCNYQINGKLLKENISFVVSYHNNHRSELAKGNVEGLNGLFPKGSNINKLVM